MMRTIDSQMIRVASRTILTCGALVICSSPVIAQGPSPDILRPGDAIRLQLSVAGEDQNFNGDYMVDEMGMLSLPVVGSMRATDVSAQQLRQRIITEYDSMFRNQSIQVTILRRIIVLGAVSNPGLYHIDPTMRISDVVATAGGVTKEGRVDEIRILRNGEELHVDLTPQSTLPSELRSGDQLFVPEKSWFARNGKWIVGVGLGVAVTINRITR